MPRIVPSQVVDFIKQIKGYDVESLSMRSIEVADLSATQELCNRIPEELLVLGGSDYTSYVRAKEKLREVLDTWAANLSGRNSRADFYFGRDINPFIRLRDLLSACPDQSPSPTTSGLTFITDLAFRSNLRSDMGEIDRALANGEWKSATVLAGSAVEAILLWDLENTHATQVPSALTALGTRHPNPMHLKQSEIEKWNLQQYSNVAAQTGSIKPETFKIVDLAREYRNFVHPGVAQRLGQKCDRATALAALSALEHVVRDLS